MARALTRGLAVCLLGLAACGRLGFGEYLLPAGEHGQPHDAAAPDATHRPDAAAPPDASAKPDASTAHDASTTPDASALPDASTTPDATVAPDAAPSCTPSAASDYCTQLTALARAPQLDGVLDCGPSLIALPASGWNSCAATLPSDNHARYAAAWRPDGLYVYIEVDDALRLPALASDVDPWCGDGVELYVDTDGKYPSAPDYDDPGTMQLIAAAPARDPSTKLAVDALYHTRSQLRIGDWSATRHVMVPRDNGYALEAFIAAADLALSGWRLASGNTIGFDIAIDVAVSDETQKVACGYSLGQYYLRLSRLPCNADNCRPYSNVAAFCTPVLQ